MSFNLKTPQEILRQVAERMKTKRLQMNLTQQGLALRANVSLGTLKHFEKTGKVSFETLLAVAMALGCLEDFDDLLKNVERPINLFDEKEPKKRMRGRVK